MTYKLTKSTSHGRLAKACRAAVEDDFPDWLRKQRQPGIELDHSGVSHAEIVREFEAQHPAVEPTRDGEQWVLPDESKALYQKLHRERTDNFRDVVPRTVQAHRELTRTRAQADAVRIAA